MAMASITDKLLNRFRSEPEKSRAHGQSAYAALKTDNERRLLSEEANGIITPTALPLYINIETTRNCNLTCPMCPFHASKETKKKWNVSHSTMPEEIFESIAEELFPTLKTCALTVTGDFTITPYLPRIFELLEKYEVRFDSFTNGALLDKEIIQRMTPLLAALTISMESPQKIAFEKWRRGANWEKVNKNIETLMAERAKFTAQPKPRLDLQAVLMHSTIRELPALVDYAAQAGFDMVKGIHLVVFDASLKDESLLYHRELYNECLEMAEANAQRHGLQTHFPPPFPLDSNEHTELAPHHERHKKLKDGTKPPCHFVWQRSFLNFDGETLACCAPEPPNLGSYIKSSFTQVWKSDAYQQLRAGHAEHTPAPPCDSCWIYLDDSIEPGKEEEVLIQIP